MTGGDGGEGLPGPIRFMDAALEGTSSSGLAMVEGLIVLFDRKGIATIGPEPETVRTIAWGQMSGASCGEPATFPGGAPAISIIAAAGRHRMRWLIPAAQLPPEGAQALDEWLAEVVGPLPAATGDEDPWGLAAPAAAGAAGAAGAAVAASAAPGPEPRPEPRSEPVVAVPEPSAAAPEPDPEPDPEPEPEAVVAVPEPAPEPAAGAPEPAPEPAPESDPEPVVAAAEPASGTEPELEAAAAAPTRSVAGATGRRNLVIGAAVVVAAVIAVVIVVVAVSGSGPKSAAPPTTVAPTTPTTAVPTTGTTLAAALQQVARDGAIQSTDLPTGWTVGSGSAPAALDSASLRQILASCLGLPAVQDPLGQSQPVVLQGGSPDYLSSPVPNLVGVASQTTVYPTEAPAVAVTAEVAAADFGSCLGKAEAGGATSGVIVSPLTLAQVPGTTLTGYSVLVPAQGSSPAANDHYVVITGGRTVTVVMASSVGKPFPTTVTAGVAEDIAKRLAADTPAA